jgi:hypothetical protein
MATTITSTTLSAKITSKQNVLTVASATNIANPVANFYQKIYVVNPDTVMGELMTVVSVSGTNIQVSRLDAMRQAFVSGATVIIAPPASSDSMFGGPYLGGFQSFDPAGSSQENMNSAVLQPWVNVTNGNQWLYSTVTSLWVASFNNNSAVKGVTAAVASAAGLVTPSGPVFHITGALAITGFNIPVGFTGGSFVVIPDGTFTWTTANNIAVAGTAVVSRAITFTFDSNTAKFYPSYV